MRHSSHEDVPGIAMQVTRRVLVASIQVDLDEGVLERFRHELLTRLHQTGSRGVILDVSGLQTLDSDEFAALRSVITMTTIMGAESLLVGLRPGIVSSLIEADADVDGLATAIDLDAAFDHLLAVDEPDEQAGEDPEDVADDDAPLAEPGDRGEVDGGTRDPGNADLPPAWRERGER